VESPKWLKKNFGILGQFERRAIVFYFRSENTKIDSYSTTTLNSLFYVLKLQCTPIN